MDDIDKKLVSILQKKGRTSLSDIGKKLGMSHVAVSKRLDKLVGSNLVQITAGVNTKSFDTKIFFIGIETENLEVAERIQENYRKCPRLLMIAPVTGRYNIIVVMIAENTWSMESIIGTCSMRTEPGVRKSETWFGNAPIYPEFMPLDLAPKSTGSAISPCGRNCADCKRYLADKCLGCPQSTVYRGTLWASPVKAKKRRKSKS